MKAYDIAGNAYDIKVADEVVKRVINNAEYFTETKHGVLAFEPITPNYNGMKYTIEGQAYKGTFSNSYEELEYFYKQDHTERQLSLF